MKYCAPLRFTYGWSSLLALIVMAACGTGSDTDDPPDGPPQGPSSPVNVADEVPETLRQALEAAAALDADGLREAYPTPGSAALGYDPAEATGMALIQASALALSEGELERLAQNGFVISKGMQFPSFAYGYKTIYAEDLPVYVSADSILEAVHRTFDALLKQTEEQVLIADLTLLLDGMRANLASSSLDAELAADADLYLTVASSLLAGASRATLGFADAKAAAELYEQASNASGHQVVSLFGVERDLDFSQFEPRGHYTDSDSLSRYFKAMMWLGRVDLRLIETQSDGSQRFYRRQFDSAVALRELMGNAETALWERIDTTIGAYVGEHDSMTPKDIGGLMAALEVASLNDSASLDDEQIIAELAAGGWGAQRIASRIIINGMSSPGTLPLDRSFLIFGQRYTVDSHTFVNVTFDRVDGRMMPNPLDVAFAALGNNAALGLLDSDLGNPSYVRGLAKTRALVDAHEASYWEGSLYTRWLDSLRSLSPNPEAPAVGVPTNEAWEKRVLSTQLGSWSQLRHDTILYAKQSYTAGAVCEFPDAFVDPYPEFYAKLGGFADAVVAVSEALPATSETLSSQIQSWASTFKGVVNNLERMAENQLTGTPHSEELIAFINDAVSWDEQSMCGGASYSNLRGWYLNLYINEHAGLQYDPTVADVHTQPTDEGGSDVGRILHVGTATPRLMIVTAETCQGPRAYAGLGYSYGELITENWERLTDDEWSQRTSQEFPDVPWMSDVLAE